MLDQLQKHSLYVNLKNYQFYQDKVRFLSYIIIHQRICIEKEQIKAVHNWSKL